MNKLLLSLATVLAAQSLYATILETDPSVIFGEMQVYGKNSQIGFEIINKATHSIWISLKNGDELWSSPKTGQNIFEVEGLKGGKRTTYRLETDINKPTELAVWLKDPKTKNADFSPSFYGIVGEKKIKPTPDRFYKFPANKTVFITWDEKDFPRPQTGPLMGILKRTDSGLSLEKNVKKEEIQEVAAAA